eukprot:gnl/Hemi2/15421_TR5187_c0_g1_i1.p1 gnl/Hemi2/15421_TR5187_c0_g1~~gnl/Hemi2/15421_TR5187_c0_g1_i1.p1  ORF type:complete len:132 (-),score=7.33 gnl/Hemi2/15421_TR5187_c0_g1_i1:176-571(-)
MSEDDRTTLQYHLHAELLKDPMNNNKVAHLERELARLDKKAAENMPVWQKWKRDTPFELLSGGVAAGIFCYRAYIPIRHRHIPFSEGQLAWRTAAFFLNQPFSPAAKRTWFLIGASAFFADRIRAMLYGRK